MPSPRITDEIRDVSFVDPLHGWVLVWRTEAAGSSPRLLGVLGTSDGGRTWQMVGRPTTSPVVTRLRFTNPVDGFAFQPDLFVTHDGGTDWTRTHVDGSVLDLESVGRSVWMLIGRCSTRGDRCRDVRLQRSADGGRTWISPEPVPMLPQTIPYMTDADHPEPQLSLVRSGPRTGWIVSAAEGDPKLPSPLLATRDGGSQWSPLPNPCSRPIRAFGRTTGPLTFEEHVSAIDSTRLWMVCTNEPAMGQADRVLYRSADGGRRWQLASGTCCLGNGLQLVAISWRLGWETDNTAAYALAPIRFGQDQHRVVADNRGVWVSLHFLGPQFGWAATNTNLLYTATDAGAKWIVRRIEPTT